MSAGEGDRRGRIGVRAVHAVTRLAAERELQDRHSRESVAVAEIPHLLRRRTEILCDERELRVRLDQRV